jgi:hypothetical protein
MIAQDPNTSLDPVFTIGEQVSGPLRYHGLARDRHEARRRAIEALEQVRIPSARRDIPARRRCSRGAAAGSGAAGSIRAVPTPSPPAASRCRCARNSTAAARCFVMSSAPGTACATVSRRSSGMADL